MTSQEAKALELAREVLEQAEPGWGERRRAMFAIDSALVAPVGTMTADRAANFMRRFRHEEKLLGPNEQAALDFVISVLEAPAAPAAQGSSWLIAADLAENNDAIREALQAFAADHTGDNAAGVVAPVLDTAPQCAAPVSDNRLAAIAADRDYWREQATTSAAPVAPAGWVLVPPKPTPEMVAAYLAANHTYWKEMDEGPEPVGKWRNGTPAEATAESYVAMLTATPAAPVAPADQWKLVDGGCAVYLDGIEAQFSIEDASGEIVAYFFRREDAARAIAQANGITKEQP